MSNKQKPLKSVKYILNFFPFLKGYIEENNKLPKGTLSENEKIFLKMIKFFQMPGETAFNYQLIFLHLKNEEVVIAHKALDIFAKHDSYMIRKPTIIMTRKQG